MNDYSFYYFSIEGIFRIWPEDRKQERRYHGCGSIYLTVNCKAIFLTRAMMKFTMNTQMRRVGS